MISVGLTGGIGSGKSTVAKFFSILGVKIYNSDEKAKEIMERDLELKDKILTLLGDEAYNEKGLNRKYIANKVFQEPIIRDGLNSIVHAAVFEDYKRFVEENKTSNYIIQESAILFEGGYENRHDLMITVISPEEIKINRLVEKGMNELDIRQRMKNQWSDKEKMDKSDFVILNNEKNSLSEQILDIHHKILARSV